MSNMDFSLILKHMDILLLGTKLTIIMTIGAITIGVILGTLLGLMRVSRSGILKGIAAVYLQIFRGTPMLLQICFLYFAIPSLTSALGMPFSWSNPLLPDAALAGIIALGLNSGAYIAEIIRSGIQGVDIGQTEAARALGLNHTQTMQLIILPQAFRRVIPPLCNEFIVLLKDTSLVSAIGAKELMYQARAMGAKYYEYFVFMIGAAVVYFCLTFIFTRIANYIERRLAVSD
ncbi:MAG: amino acid ABC transporter permease [Peptococcaceae bacterium]|nr:amino acid ABC transporter permease [Peptococcaceae bacterium]